MTYESELSMKLKDLPEIKLSAVHVGLVEKTTDSNVKVEPYGRYKYLQDNFSVTIEYKGKSYTTSFSMGIGHRKPSKIFRVKKEGNRYYHINTGDWKTEKEACEANWLVVTTPSLADVMSGLLLDSRCAEGTFEDFCGEMGYDSDSRKALETYLACQTTRNHMLSMLGRELFDALSQLEH